MTKITSFSQPVEAKKGSCLCHGSDLAPRPGQTPPPGHRRNY